MGLLIDGEWSDRWYDTDKTGGRFQRKESAFRNWVTADGSAGLSGDAGFKAEPGRYHLYVSLACPWAHRVLRMISPGAYRSTRFSSGRNKLRGRQRVSLKKCSWL